MDADLLGGVIAPLTAAYGVLLAMIWAWWRRAERGATGSRAQERAEEADGEAPAPPLASLLRYLVAMAAGGSAVFMAIVFVFSFMFADQQEAIGEALTGGGGLVAIVVPLLTAAGALERTLRRRVRRAAG
jgi:polyferredoxin